MTNYVILRYQNGITPQKRIPVEDIAGISKIVKYDNKYFTYSFIQHSKDGLELFYFMSDAPTELKD